MNQETEHPKEMPTGRGLVWEQCHAARPVFTGVALTRAVLIASVALLL